MEHLRFWILLAAVLIGLKSYILLSVLVSLALIVHFLTEREKPLPPNDFKVAIVGAGFSGIAMGIKCQKLGLDYDIYDAAQDLGGTWRDNVYPGCACDITSHLYAYSFAPNPNWSKKFATQPEICQYLRDVAHKHDLNIQYGRKVEEVEWKTDKLCYRVIFSDGKTTEANFVIQCAGPLREPVFPDFPGQDKFEGRSFHSARWDTSYDVTGKRVAVVGTGASAVQIVPSICEKVGGLFVFQRTPPWVPARNERSFPTWVKWAFANIPGVMYAHRLHTFFVHEGRYFALLQQRIPLAWIWRRLFTRRYYDIIKDKELAEKLIPKYEIGCKRITPSDEYLYTFNRQNVHLVTDLIEKVTKTGLQTKGGEKIDVDAIVYATGYSPLDSLLNAFTIKDGKGQTLVSKIEDVPEFYKGIAPVGFPNLFFLLGPNTNLNYHSIVWMGECQVNYIARLISEMVRCKAKSVSVRSSVLQRYYKYIRYHMKEKPFENGGCLSWYKKGMDGTNFNQWPCCVSTYWWETLRADLADYHVTYSSKEDGTDKD